MKFQKLTVFCTTETSDIISYMLHEAGSMGEIFDDYNNIRQVLKDKLWDYANEHLFNETLECSVSGFFPLEADVQTICADICALRNESYADFSAIGVAVDTIDSVEWENEWKKYYKPFNIGKIVIVPEWISYNELGDIPVLLNPGLAFGTGMHETTSMCIDLMQKIELNGKRVLDFGCGSGILGICATALGAKSVVFADMDEQAITATRYNCKLNGIEDPEILSCDVRNMHNRADVVMANITADVLVDVCDVIKAALNGGGYAIISGVISDKRKTIIDTYSQYFTLVESEQKNEWSAYLFKL